MNRKGQTLVELAVALPLFALGLVVTALLAIYCRNMVAMQLMALKAARKLTADAGYALPVALIHPLWGPVSPPRYRRVTQIPQPWRPFRGPSVVTARGHLISLSITSQLLPGSGYLGSLQPARQAAGADTLVEPPLPAEN